MADQRIILSDGSTLLVDADLPDEQVKVLARNAEEKLDPSNTDDWLTYIDKLGKSATRGGVGGLASTGDLAKNFLLDAPANAINYLTGDPTRHDLWDAPVRDAYERNVIPQPKGSDYETTANVSEVVVPALVETALTGSPKSSVLRTAASVGGRTARDLALGQAGGFAGEEIGKVVGGERGGEIGRVLGGALTPMGGTRTGVRVATGMGGPSLGLRTLGLQRFDPTNLIPATNPRDFLARTATGATAATSGEYGKAEAEAEARRLEVERYRKLTGR